MRMLHESRSSGTHPWYHPEHSTPQRVKASLLFDAVVLFVASFALVTALLQPVIVWLLVLLLAAVVCLVLPMALFDLYQLYYHRRPGSLTASSR